MNRTIKEATVKRCHYDDHVRLGNPLDHVLATYNFGRRIKTLKELTPWEFVCRQWAKEPERFSFIPLHQMPGRDIWIRCRCLASSATLRVIRIYADTEAWEGLITRKTRSR